MERKMYRSDTDYVIAGVCGGISEYFGFNSLVLRIIWIFFIGPNLLLYILLMFLLPSRPRLY
ncbi:PspC domain-containing protein [Clostridium sardiniense]|uniref:PspC domain-containing protein n=1 Tax=Clostridium sardiniense TaxID=29369 RepID=UPI003D34FB9C